MPKHTMGRVYTMHFMSEQLVGSLNTVYTIDIKFSHFYSRSVFERGSVVQGSFAYCMFLRLQHRYVRCHDTEEEDNLLRSLLLLPFSETNRIALHQLRLIV